MISFGKNPKRIRNNIAISKYFVKIVYTGSKALRCFKIENKINVGKDLRYQQNIFNKQSTCFLNGHFVDCDQYLKKQRRGL